MKSGSLRLRLVIAGAVSIFAAIVLSGIGLSILFDRHVERRVVAELGAHLRQVIAGVGLETDGKLALLQALADPRFERPLSGLYWQIETQGSVQRSRSLWDTELVLPAGDNLADEIQAHRIAGPGGRELIAIGRSVTLPAQLGAGKMRAVVATDVTDIAAATREFTNDLLPYLALLALFLVSAAYVQVAVGLRPLADVRKRLTAIREGKARRIGSDFPQEILPLASEVDALLEARETQLGRARSRAADLAHGLKTPLQVLSGDVNRLRGKGENGIADKIEQVATSMQRHVDRELARARMATGVLDSRARIEEVVRRVISVASRTPAGAKIKWAVDIPAGLTARIDPDDLAEAIGNLIENATRHARRRVRINTRRAAGCIVIAIADDGPGMPEDLLEEALLRGGQFNQNGSGAGLGLAIVRDIADVWEGNLEIRTDENGFTAEFTLQR